MNKYKSIKLTMAKNYVSDWGFWEATRELAQNALDHKDSTGEEISVGYHRPLKQLRIVSTNCKLSLSSLVLGCSTKTDDTAIRGQFGEGYKLALLVLVRLGLSVRVYNQDEIWVPCFEYDKELDTELLTIKVYPNDTRNKNVIFTINGITHDMSLKVKNRLVIDRVESIGFKTDFGTILTEERFKGQIFVGGLYVSTPALELKHGFDFDPEHVTLGRDRGLIDSFDIQWLASQMWLSIQHEDTTALSQATESIYTGSSGTGYVGNFDDRNKVITESIADKFYSNYSETSVPVSSESDARTTLHSYDNAIPVIVSPNVKRMIEKSARFKEVKGSLKPRMHLTPNEIVNDLLSKYKHDLGPMYKILVEELVPLSLRWVALQDEIVKDTEEL
jgi:hypothetical protein